jgi:spore maturation protein CgeB
VARQFKIFRLWSASQQQEIRRLYNDNNELAFAPYEAQMERFFGDKITYSNSFSRSMGALGHEIMEVVLDLEPAQKAWAREHGVSWTDWKRDIPLAQIAAFKPDIVYLHSLVAIPAGLGADAKAQCPAIRSVVAYAGSDLYDGQLRGVDLLIVGVLPMLAQYRAKGLQTHLVYHGFDTDVLTSLDEMNASDKPRFPFTFLGSSGFGYKASFVTRYWLLIEMLARTELQAWLSDAEELMPLTHAMNWSVLESMRQQLLRQVQSDRSTEQLKFFISKIVGSLPMTEDILKEYQSHVVPGDGNLSPMTPLVPLTKILPEKCHSPVFGLKFYDLLRRSDVTLNVQVDLNKGTTANMRMFEATGVGTCLLTDKTSNLGELYEPDTEVATYGSIEECIEKSNYLMQNAQARRAIAEAGQKRTLREHTIDHRCREIDALLQTFVP